MLFYLEDISFLCAVGGGKEGVALFINKMKNELCRCYVFTGTADVKKVNRGIIVYVLILNYGPWFEGVEYEGNSVFGGGITCRSHTSGGIVFFNGQVLMGWWRVTFDHRVHASKCMVCNDCHATLLIPKKRRCVYNGRIFDILIKSVLVAMMEKRHLMNAESAIGGFKHVFKVPKQEKVRRALLMHSLNLLT